MAASSWITTSSMVGVERCSCCWCSRVLLVLANDDAASGPFALPPPPLLLLVLVLVLLLVLLLLLLLWTYRTSAHRTSASLRMDE